MPLCPDGDQPPVLSQGLGTGVHLTQEATAIYQLSDLGPLTLHPWAHHIGSLGFLEFVIVLNKTKTLELLVASDD
jgi:hypothetical protein